MSRDADVLSVPVGQTSHLVRAFNVYACPDNRSYRDTAYITYRPKGGEMASVFPIETIYIFPPNSPLPESVLPEHQEDLRKYVAARLANGLFDWPDRPYRFYMLEPDKAKKLPHLPAPAHNPQGHCYFTLEELISGKKIVSVASGVSA